MRRVPSAVREYPTAAPAVATATFAEGCGNGVVGGRLNNALPDSRAVRPGRVPSADVP
jgi:hypothetical protein